MTVDRLSDNLQIAREFHAENQFWQEVKIAPMTA
jgi:hypothetical protein